MTKIQDCCSYLLLLREKENLRGNETKEKSESTLVLSDWAQPDSSWSFQPPQNCHFAVTSLGPIISSKNAKTLDQH